ncbi:MAG: hypothetical protein LBN41_11465 [Enterobacteriaceae bacterium]|jgi:hypothetical protein|nr:hypothetical protein [Enterobacteriaceae bacterium]
MTKIYKLVISILLLLSAGCFYLAYTNNGDHLNSCVGRYAATKEALTVKLLLNVSFNKHKGNGMLLMEGKLIDDKNKTTTIVDRQTQFTYDKVDNNYFLKSTSTFVRPDDTADTELLKLNLPAFFLYGDKTTNYLVYKQGKRGYVFTISKSPFFYCLV